MSSRETKVTVFLPSDPQAREVLTAFAHGIPDAWVRELTDRYIPCDVAVLFGLNERDQIRERGHVMSKHMASRSLLIVDQAYVHRGDYFSVGWNNAGRLDHCTFGAKLDRWVGFGIRPKPWRNRPRGPVVVIGQIPWRAVGYPGGHALWCADTVRWFEDHATEVHFRPHPKLLDWKKHYPGIRGERVDNRPLSALFDEARCIVTWNSNVAVEAAIAGVPVVASGPGSIAAPVALKHHAQFFEYVEFERRDWFAGLGYSQWASEEMSLGLPWKHLRGAAS
jgi:hypothetical protein